MEISSNNRQNLNLAALKKAKQFEPQKLENKQYSVAKSASDNVSISSSMRTIHQQVSSNDPEDSVRQDKVDAAKEELTNWNKPNNEQVDTIMTEIFASMAL